MDIYINSTGTHPILMPPPTSIIIAFQLFGLFGNALNHRATRVIFDNNAVEISIANSFISMAMVLIILGFIEIFIENESVNTFQGPIFITSFIIIHPVLLLNGFAEMGYTCGTAAVYKSSIGIVLKVVATFIAALCTKTMLPLLGLGNSIVSGFIYFISICFAIPGVFFSLTERKNCYGANNEKPEEPDDAEESDDVEKYEESDTMLEVNKINSINNTSNSIKYSVYIGFFVLALSNTFWTLFQVIFAREYNINHFGYISLDQVYGSLTTIAITAIGTCLPCTQNWTHNKTAGDLFGTVIKKTFGSICTSPMAFLYLAISKFIANSMIVVYFLLSTKYDPGMVVLEMSLVKVLVGVMYTICVAFGCPTFLAMTQEELNEIKSISYITKRVIGIVCIIIALYILK